MRHVLLVGATCLLIAAALAAASAPRTVTEPYLATSFVPLEADVLGCDADLNLGAACVRVLPGETSVRALVQDASGLPVGADLQFEPYTGIHLFCADSGVVPVPPGAREVRVIPLDPLGNLLFCQPPGSPFPPAVAGVATTGTVTFSFA